MTKIDGLDIHFIHVRSKHPNALPIIITHGWPGSILEQMKIIDPLTNPTAHGGTRGGCVRRRDPVDAGLRVFRQADRARLGSRAHRARLGRADEAPRIHEIRRARRRLGRAHHRLDGRTGGSGIDRHPHQHAWRGSARHRQGGPERRPGAGRPLSRREAARTIGWSSSTRAASPTRSRWRTAHRRCTGLRIHPSAWRPG